MYIAVLQWSSRLWCELLQFRVTMLDGCSRGSLPVFMQHWWMNENRIRTHDLWIWRPELYPWTMASPNGLVTHRELFSAFFWCSDDVIMTDIFQCWKGPKERWLQSYIWCGPWLWQHCIMLYWETRIQLQWNGNLWWRIGKYKSSSCKWVSMKCKNGMYRKTK